MLSMHCTHATRAQICMSLTVGLKTGYHVLLERDTCTKLYHRSALLKTDAVKSVRVQPSSVFLQWEPSVSVRDQPHYDKTGLMSQTHSWSFCSTPGGRWRMYLPWKWSYRRSTQNIKQCLVCCLLKSRTNGMEAKQHQGCTVRRKTQKSIFRVELHFPNPQVCTLLSTHSFLGSLFYF